MKVFEQRRKWSKEELIEFEEYVGSMFERGEINAPVHLCGGNENQLIKLFEDICDDDWVFSTHRSHYHYLLKGGSPQMLLDELQGKKSGMCGGVGRSMHIYDTSINFYTSAIVGGITAIAVGTAVAIQRSDSTEHVWCFVGDGAVDRGSFYESVRYAEGYELPVTFVIEDNDLAVDTTKHQRWGNGVFNDNYIIEYSYTRRYPHVGIGKHVSM